MPSLRSAFRREGSKGVLGVFTPGEEILGIKTGEAGRYQALEKRLGKYPLAKIPNFAEGGTIDVNANVLSGFGNTRPNIDLSNINLGGSRPGAIGFASARSAIANRTINLQQTIVTPNADSFNLNQDQRNQDLLETLKRGF